MGWRPLLRRAVLLLDKLCVTRSLRKTAAHYITTVGRAFPDVLTTRAGSKHPDDWIDDRIAFAYTALSRTEYVRNVETWGSDDRLVGRPYGVHQVGMFAGKSMFHHPELGRDASKVALLRLVAELARARINLLDAQRLIPHLVSFEVVELSRRGYPTRLGVALEGEHRSTWSSAERQGSRRLLVVHV